MVVMRLSARTAVYLSAFLPLLLYVYLSDHTAVCLSVCLSARTVVSLPVSLSARTVVWLFGRTVGCLGTCVPACVSVCLSAFVSISCLSSHYFCSALESNLISAH